MAGHRNPLTVMNMYLGDDSLNFQHQSENVDHSPPASPSHVSKSNLPTLPTQARYIFHANTENKLMIPDPRKFDHRPEVVDAFTFGRSVESDEVSDEKRNGGMNYVLLSF